jgi:hypothetical protein
MGATDEFVIVGPPRRPLSDEPPRNSWKLEAYRLHKEIDGLREVVEALREEVLTLHRDLKWLRSRKTLRLEAALEDALKEIKNLNE